MDTSEQKRAAAAAAWQWIEGGLGRDVVIGVGTGSTADHFIDLLAPHADRFAGAVASSTRSAERLAARGVAVLDLNAVERLPFYVDGADEIDGDLSMVKGGGGALTREKIVAAVAERFVCIVDGSKRVDVLGRFALPIEVVPMARAQVVRALVRLGRELALGDTRADLRLAPGGEPYLTDNAGCIVDVTGWSVTDPRRLEAALGSIVGVIESGLFALRGADVLLSAEADAVRAIERNETVIRRA